jgi:hypothetical protein
MKRVALSSSLALGLCACAGILGVDTTTIESTDDAICTTYVTLCPAASVASTFLVPLGNNHDSCITYIDGDNTRESKATSTATAECLKLTQCGDFLACLSNAKIITGTCLFTGSTCLASPDVPSVNPSGFMCCTGTCMPTGGEGMSGQCK